MSNTIPFPMPEPERLPDRLPDPEPIKEPKKEKIILDERGMIDLPFLLLTVLLVLIGVIMMFSASYAAAHAAETTGHSPTYYFFRQGMFALLGIGVMIFVGRFVNYHLWEILSRPIMAVTIVLMILTPIFGLTGGGATRWIRLGPLSFQPSEVAKLAIVLSFSRRISKSTESLKTLRGLAPYLAIIFIMIVTMVAQSHLSGMIIICAVAAVMLFLGGFKIRYFLIAFAGMALGLILYLNLRGYAMDRITAWLDPWSDPQDTGFQIIQSLLAIGSGGLMGLGLGRSRQKYLYLPEEHNDYIFPIVCEELGFVGAVVIILLFMLLIIRGYWIAMHAKDRFGSLVVAGITTLLALQVFFNIGVVTNFLPSTGISLPFFSYGGTALLLQMFEMGLILSVSRQSDNQLLI